MTYFKYNEKQSIYCHIDNEQHNKEDESSYYLVACALYGDTLRTGNIPKGSHLNINSTSQISKYENIK